MVGVPLFFNLAFVPTDNISGMDADILISLKKPHRPASHYMREIRAKMPPKFPGSTLLLPERRHRDAGTELRPAGTDRRPDPGRQLRAGTDLCRPDAESDRGNPGRGGRAPACRCSTIPRCGSKSTGCARRDWDLPSATWPTACSRRCRVRESCFPSYFLSPNGVNYTVSVQTPIDKIQSVDDLMATPITVFGSEHYRRSGCAPDADHRGRRAGHPAVEPRCDQTRDQLPVCQSLHGAARDRHRRQYRRPRPGWSGLGHQEENRRHRRGKGLSAYRQRSSSAASTRSCRPPFRA